jgi:hypothetical protein
MSIMIFGTRIGKNMDEGDLKEKLFSKYQFYKD